MLPGVSTTLSFSSPHAYLVLSFDLELSRASQAEDKTQMPDLQEACRENGCGLPFLQRAVPAD
jgi:hypothetical protein